MVEKAIDKLFLSIPAIWLGFIEAFIYVKGSF
jgi:hypothetical protein